MVGFTWISLNSLAFSQSAIMDAQRGMTNDEWKFGESRRLGVSWIYVVGFGWIYLDSGGFIGGFEDFLYLGRLNVAKLALWVCLAFFIFRESCTSGYR